MPGVLRAEKPLFGRKSFTAIKTRCFRGIWPRQTATNVASNRAATFALLQTRTHLRGCDQAMRIFQKLTHAQSHDGLRVSCTSAPITSPSRLSEYLLGGRPSTETHIKMPRIWKSSSKRHAACGGYIHGAVRCLLLSLEKKVNFFGRQVREY